MASNDQWPPVASAGKATAKVNSGKRNVKESQQQILKVVNEMFGSSLEPEVILSVVQNCNWEMQPSIEGLITLTETVDNPLIWNSAENREAVVPSAPLAPRQTSGLRGGNREASKPDLTSLADSQANEPRLPSKWEKPKKGGAKNRMDSFCGNIAKLKSSGDSNVSANTDTAPRKAQNKQKTPIPMDDDFLFKDILNYGASGAQRMDEKSPKCVNYGDLPGIPVATQPVERAGGNKAMFPPAGESFWRTNHRSSQPSFSPSTIREANQSRSSPSLKRSSKKEKFQDTKAAAEELEFNRVHRVAQLDSKTNVRKAESGSLCGLKVQYRTTGMESSSDDDADVVIEDEASDYKINLASSMPISVSQFLSPSTQSAPRRTNPEFQMISTPSPPRTPQRNAHDAAFNRIKSSIRKGHKVMILLRGLPGSGKSTLAKSIVSSTIGGNSAPHVFNTDDFFVNLGRGVYKYDPSRLQDAHNANHKRVWQAVKEGRSPVIVDNTHIEAWEMRPYAAMAVENGYVVEILEPDTPWAHNVNELAKKNTHGVPKAKIRGRAERFERVPSGKHLLERFSLKYSAQNNPPQMRLVPPVEATNETSAETRIDDIKSNWENHEKNNFVLTSHDIESMQNIDETRAERASGAGEDSSESSSNQERGTNVREELFNDYLQELQDSDDESFEMLEGSSSEHLSDVTGKLGEIAKLSTEENGDGAESKDTSPGGSQLVLGAIGSERKGSVSVASSVGNLHEVEKSETKSPENSQLTLGAIGSERKGSLSVAGGGHEAEKETKSNSSPEGSQQNLGAIGSERKGNSAGNLADDKPEAKDLNGAQPTLRAIGSERKGSFSVASGAGIVDEKLNSPVDEIKENVLTQCWDFTLLLGRYKIHSRHSALDLPAARLPETEANDGGTESPAQKDEEAIEEITEKDEEAIEEITEKVEEAIEKITEKDDDSILNVDTVLIEEIAVDKEPRDDAADSSSNNDSFDVAEETVKLVEKLENENECKIDETAKGEDENNTQEAEEEATDVEIPSSAPREALSEENSEEAKSVDGAVEKMEEAKSVEGAVEKIEEAKSVDEAVEKIEEAKSVDGAVEKIEEAKNTNGAVEKIAEAKSVDGAVEKIAEAKSVDVAVGKIEEATEVTEEKATEVPESAPKVSTAFGTFFNMLKTSILGGAEEPSSELKAENPDVSGSTIYETAVSSSPSEADKDSVRVGDDDNDTVDSPGSLEKSSESDSFSETIATQATSSSADKTDKIYGQDLSTNPFREEMIKSREEKPRDDDATDNMNSITWKESPFPLDAAEIPAPPILDDEKIVQTSDAFTNTTYYDFNVAYVGGTSEPGYRELAAVSRCINQWPPSAARSEPRPPVKWMLDKSSMTSEVNILATEASVSVEKEKEPSDRIQELVELFPNIPIDALTAFYNQECKGNFDWAVEVLLEDQPADFALSLLEKKIANPENEDLQAAASGDPEKKAEAVELERLKRKSHSASPRHRRQRSKDFRSLSIDFAENRGWPCGEFSVDEKDLSSISDKEEKILQSFYENATSLPIAIGEIPEASSSSTGSGPTETEDDTEDILEFDFGRDFIGQLEKAFGNRDFAFPEEFKPVLRVKKSMAEELHALWIQSMEDQLNEHHARLDEMIAKDEEIARALDREETAQPSKEPVVPNLEEIMDMEMALASYQNELKEKMARETPNDLASRLSRQMLYESLPDIDPQTLSEILKAHNGNFKETCETIENSTGRTISKSDTLKKQQSLLDRVREERENRGIPENVEDIAAPLIVVRPDVGSAVRDEKLSYRSAVARGKDARKEAQKHFSLRIENFNKAAEAYRKGQPEVAAYYSQMAKLHSDNIEAAHAEAADAFVDAQIYYSDDDTTLDLHNFFVPEALVALDTFLEIQSRKLAKSNKRSTTLYIITGRGARSNNGLSKIKPAVSKRLISRNIRFTEANAGCLKVTLSKKNVITE